jgi:hypothetical protein
MKTPWQLTRTTINDLLYIKEFAMHEKIKIKCIGFSVTGYGEPAYPIVISQRLKELGVDAEVSYNSIGGLSIDSLPFLLKSFVKKGDADLVVLELATSWFSLIHTNINSAIKYINLITSYLESIETRIIFLNLYRENINDEDIVVEAIKSISHNKYPVLDFKKNFRQQLKDSNDDGTIDGVHPRQDTINFMVGQFCDFLVENYSSLNSFSNLTNFESLLNLEIPPSLHECEVFKFKNRHGMDLDSYKIPWGTRIKHEFEERIILTGLFFLYGPDTNQINLYLDNEKINIPMKDSMSFYRRLGYKHFGSIEVKSIEIEHPAESIKIQLAKETIVEIKTFSNYIIGFTKHI